MCEWVYVGVSECELEFSYIINYIYSRSLS